MQTGKGLSFPGKEWKPQAAFTKVQYLEYVTLLLFHPGIPMWQGLGRAVIAGRPSQLIVNVPIAYRPGIPPRGEVDRAGAACPFGG